MPDHAEIEAALMAIAAARGAGKTFCPSEVARRLADDWRPLMQDVRRVAATTDLVATQNGREVDPVTVKGPLRLGLRQPFSSS